MKARIRQFLHARPFQPFFIRMDYGVEYRVEDPAFVFVAPGDYPRIMLEEDDGTMHFLCVPRMSDVEQIADAPKQAA